MPSFDEEGNLNYFTARAINPKIKPKYVNPPVKREEIIFNEMSVLERKKIQNNNFDILWKEMWGETNIGGQYKNEETISQKKFEMLKNGIFINNEMINLDILIKNSNTNWNETSWGSDTCLQKTC